MRDKLVVSPKLFLGKPVSFVVGATKGGITLGSIPDGAAGALVTASLADFMWGYTDVATNNGIYMKVGNPPIDFDNNDVDGGVANPYVAGTARLSKIQFVRITGTDGLVTFQFYQR